MQLAAIDHADDPGLSYHHLSGIIIPGGIGELVYAVGGVGTLYVLHLGQYPVPAAISLDLDVGCLLYTSPSPRDS